jgi:DNA-binding LacI/PurR family transcriptional regulator
MARQDGKKRSGQITMRDVAKLAGVSQGTVSRVLSQSLAQSPISEETYQKVLDAVERLGYHPNMTARSLRTQKTFMLAIMIADISNAFYHIMVRTIQGVARSHGYDVLMADTDQLYENEKHFCEAVIRRPVDGVIMVPYQLSTEDVDHLIKRTGAAVVALGQHLTHPMVDVVFADDEKATFDAITWLIKTKGHRDIGFIGVPATMPPGVRRLRAFYRAMDAAGVPVQPGFIQEGDFMAESGYHAMGKLMRLPHPPSAVFACNDRMAIGAMGAALSMGLRIPQDVAVVGFDNIPEATLVYPHLTTVAQFPVDIGRKLAEAVFERIEGQAHGPRRTFEIPCQLIERQST